MRGHLGYKDVARWREISWSFDTVVYTPESVRQSLAATGGCQGRERGDKNKCGLCMNGLREHAGNTHSHMKVVMQVETPL